MKEVDFAAVSDGQLKPGDYDLEIKSVTESESASGNECLDIVFVEVNDEGRYFERVPLLESTMWRVKRLAAACGLDVSGSYTVADLKQDFVGSVVHANIIMRQSPDGEDRPQAKSFSPVK